VLSDAKLIDEVSAGDHQAYAVLVKRYERLARAVATRIVRDPHIADDVAQESFLAAFTSINSLKDKSLFSVWLLGIVRRQAARAMQRRGRFPALIDATGLETQTASNRAMPQESLELLELVETLPEHERVVVGLRHYEGHSLQEIAEITDRPIGTVTKQLSRAHHRLRTWLEKEILQ
jgi:RNA polymerase sigma-70 factor (ECF subfamily)